MSNEYLDDYLPIIAIDVAIEEKTKIAEMAAASLRKLHDMMCQIKNWREDSAKLKSNIWRMKMALCTDDKNGNDNQQIDPLIVHQKTEIDRLKQTNDALENEVTCLKLSLARAEEDIARAAVCEIGDKIVRIEDEFSNEKERLNDEILCLRKQLREVEESQTSVVLKQLEDKLKEFAIGDRTIEAVFANAIGKIVETVVNLSEELVNVSGDLYKFKTKNRNLHYKMNRLRAMLRTRCGSSAEYRKRIGELNNLAEQLMGEMGRLKVIRGNANYSESSDTTDIPDIVRHVERLMNDLRNNLKSDREAMIAAGDPDCLKYMKRVVDLKVNLKVLSVELRQSDAPIYKRSCENVQYKKYLKTATLLNNFLSEIDTEIGKLKVKPMDKYCRIGGISGSQYLSKVVELENIVRKSFATIVVLKQDPLGITNSNGTIMEELEGLIERLCCKIKDIEFFDDRASLRERIEHLESSVMHLKLELVEKNERASALNYEYASIRLTLERDRKKHEKIIADLREENGSLQGDIKKRKQEISELSHKCANSERRVAEMQLMKVEIDAARKKLQALHDDKETLLGETEEMRNILRERDKEIENIITQRDALTGALRAEVEDLKTKLEIASDENVKLRSIIEGLGKRGERERLDKLKSSEKEDGGVEDRDNGERSQDRARNLRDELERLKAESNESKISLNGSNKRTDHWMCPLDKAVGDRAKLENEISDLKSNEQSLTYRLNVQTSAGKETPRELERVMAGSEALESKVKQLQNEKEQLEAELSELRSEKGLLDRSLADANNKCAALLDQVNKFKSERNGLQEKISEHEATAENLKFELKRTRAELEGAAVKTACLRTENSRVIGDLDMLSLRNTETEGRVRALLTEKNELATRINELNDENVVLREWLNKAKAENEYFSMELNKSRVENDKAKAKNTLLQVTCDEEERNNTELRRERDDARRRLNEIGSECRMLGNQLKIHRMKYEALRFAAATLYYKNNDRRSDLNKIDTRYPLVRDHERGFVDAHNEIKHKRDCLDAMHTDIKIEIGGRRNSATEFKVESDTYAGRDKAKIKDEDELKRFGTNNKALKFERADLKSENSQIMMELIGRKDEFKGSMAWTMDLNNDKNLGSFLKKFEIINICCEKKINNYSSDPNIFYDKESSTVTNIDQFETENRALRMEVDILCSILDSSLMDGQKTKIDFDRATEEIEALKFELMNLRDEKATLRSRLEMSKEELNALKSERIALKDELAASRKSNFDFRLKTNDLRDANEKLKERNAGLQSRLQDVLRKMDECIIVSEISDKSLRDNLGSALNSGLKKCIFTKKNLRLVNKRLNRPDCIFSNNPEL